MIRLTKKLLFAIEAVLDIAYNGGQAPVRSSEITEGRASLAATSSRCCRNWSGIRSLLASGARVAAIVWRAKAVG